MRICLKYLKLRYAQRLKERSSRNDTENMNAPGRDSPPRNWLQDYGILFDPAMPPPPPPPPASTPLHQSVPVAPIASYSNQLPIPWYSNQLQLPSMSNQPPPPPTTSPNGTILQKEEHMNADSPKAAEGVPEPDMMPAYSREIKPNVAPDAKSNIMCRDFVRGICVNEAVCQFRHEIIPEQLSGVFTFCRDFENKKSCKYISCKYVHATLSEKVWFHRSGYLPPHTTAHLQHNENYFKPPGHLRVRSVPGACYPSVASWRSSQLGMSQYPYPGVPQARSANPAMPYPSPRGLKRNWGTSEYPAAGTSLPKASPFEPRRKCNCGGAELSGGSTSMGYPNPSTTSGPNSSSYKGQFENADPCSSHHERRTPEPDKKEIKHCVNGIVAAAAAIVASSFSQVMDQMGNEEHPYHGYHSNWNAYYGPHQRGPHDNGHPYYGYGYGPYNYGPYNNGQNFRQTQSQQTLYGHPNYGRSNSRHSLPAQQPRQSPRLPPPMGQVPPPPPPMVQPNSGVPNNGDPPMVQPNHGQPNNVQLNHEHAYPGYPYNNQ